MSRSLQVPVVGVVLPALAILVWRAGDAAEAPASPAALVHGHEVVDPGRAIGGIAARPESPRDAVAVAPQHEGGLAEPAAVSEVPASGQIDVYGRIAGDRALVVELLPDGATREIRLLTTPDGSFRGKLTAPLCAIAIAVLDFEGPLFEVRRERSQELADADWDLGVIERPPVAAGAVVLEVAAEREVAAALLASRRVALRAKVRLVRDNGPVAVERVFTMEELARADGVVSCELGYEGGDFGRPVFVEWVLDADYWPSSFAYDPGGADWRGPSPSLGIVRIDELPFAGGEPRLGRFSLLRSDVVMGRLVYADGTTAAGLLVEYAGTPKQHMIDRGSAVTDDTGSFCFVLGAAGAGTVSASQYGKATVEVVRGQEVTLRLGAEALRLRLVDASGRPIEDFGFHGPLGRKAVERHPDGIVLVPARLLETDPWVMFTFSDRTFGLLRIPATWLADPRWTRDVSADRFEPTGSVRVVIAGANANAPPQVGLSLRGQGRIEGLTFHRWAPLRGAFVIPSLPAGAYRFEAKPRLNGDYVDEGEIEVVPGRETRLRLPKRGQ